MKILIIGATRGVGLNLLSQSLSQGHTVSVLARDPDSSSLSGKEVRIIGGDIMESERVVEAVRGQDVVCLCIGIAATRKPVNVFSTGTKHVVDAMEAEGIKRLICVTGIGAGDSKGHGGFFYDKLFNPLFLKTIYADKDKQESIIRESHLDWVIVRPGFLFNGPVTKTYKILTDLKGVTSGKISRGDVADFLLSELEEGKYRKLTPLLTY